ncbi:MAG: glycosyltransferase [Pseudomonadota bacterium]
MKIAMFTNTYLPAVGGIERSVDVTSRRLREEGHEVLVVAPEYDNAEESTDEILRVPAIKQFAGSPFSISLNLPEACAERIERFSPDIVHSHQPFLLGDSALRLARALDVPIVYSNHTFMERYLHWFPVELQILRDIAESLPVAYANLVDHVVAPTQSVAQIMRQRGTSTPITVIPTGIDAAFYAGGDRRSFRARFGLAPDHLVIGHLGRLNPEKNLAYLAQVAAHFVAQAPDQRRFLLVGAGDCVDDFRHAFTNAAIAGQLVYAGLLQGQDCADAYAAMDAFVFTSLTDTQGLVLSEAMAAGNPVFALDAPGARDIITHERNGYLFEADTPAAAFAARMGQVLSDPVRCAQMRAEARAAAHALSIPKCTQAMLALYQSLVDKNAPGARTMTTWEKIKSRWDVEVDLLQEKLSCLLR